MELVARNPYQLQNAHSQMIEWCDRKIAECHAAAEEWGKALEIAVERKWKQSQIKDKLNLAARKVVFYTKIKAAISEGYYIVPNFECTVFAIRTKQAAPSRFVAESQWQANHKQSAQALPIGEGRYVSPDPTLEHDTYQDKNQKGELVTKHQWWPSEFQEVEFPFDLAKPAVMQPAASAMVSKIFDMIGVSRNVTRGYQTKRGDPIIIGIIKNPQPSRPDISFFITWAFNPDVL